MADALPSGSFDAHSRVARLVLFERALAIAISSLSVATLVVCTINPEISRAFVWEAGEDFHVPYFSIYFFLASFGVAALLALSIALRNGLTSPAYSLAAGLAAWSGCAILVIEPNFVSWFFYDVLFVLVWYQMPWSAARFALHFPVELRAIPADDPGQPTRRWAIGPERIRRFVDSAIYPTIVTVGTLTLMFGEDVLESALGHQAFNQIAPWSALLLSAVMAASAFLLLMHQRKQADEAGIRRLRWIWLGAWGAAAILVPALGVVFPLLSHGEHLYLAFLLVGMAPVWLIGCVIVAVFFSDALDARLALRRATLYSILAVLMTALFIGVEGLVQGYLIVNTGMPNTTGIIVAGSVVGVSFSPVRRRTEVWVKQLVEQMMPAEVMAAGRREPATIAFVDLSGYTSLADKDERSALVLAAGFHKEMAKAANRSSGRVVKKIGDALLLEFRSNDDALRAIREGSAGFAKLVAALELPVLRAHAGVHTGEVVHMPDGDVMGAAVNVAARLMSAAQVDQIVVSLGDDEIAPADQTAIERVECKGISAPIACRRLVIAAA